MNINLYKKYSFSHGSLTATDTGKEYKFSIGQYDRFYHYMEKHIIKEKVEGLSYETIDSISIEDVDKTFFKEKSFTLNTGMLVTDKNDNIQLYMLTMRNVRFSENKVSQKIYNNGFWELEKYDLEIPYQTNIDIIEVLDQ